MAKAKAAKRRAPNRHYAVTEAKYAPMPAWAKEGVERDLALIDAAQTAIDQADKALIACIQGVQMHATRRYIQGIERLPMSFAHRRLLKQARDSADAALRDRQQELRRAQTTASGPRRTTAGEDA